MKERPILFSGPMVCAILEGRKTQTRRVVKPFRDFPGNNICNPHMAYHPWDVWWHGAETDRVGCLQTCPFGKPGDRLWVRETWQKCTGCNEGNGVIYRADCGHVPAHKWRPSIFMPREFSRITLEITDIRVERLREISEDDAKAEGVNAGDPITQEDIDGLAEGSIERALAEVFGTGGRFTAKFNYSMLWDSINGDGAWATNPWVWVLTFKRVETNA